MTTAERIANIEELIARLEVCMELAVNDPGYIDSAEFAIMMFEVKRKKEST